MQLLASALPAAALSPGVHVAQASAFQGQKSDCSVADMIGVKPQDEERDIAEHPVAPPRAFVVLRVASCHLGQGDQRPYEQHYVVATFSGGSTAEDYIREIFFCETSSAATLTLYLCAVAS